MNKNHKLCISALILALSSQILSGTFEFQLDFSSKYIWRGFDLNPRCQPVLQPSVNYTPGKNLSLNLWGSFSFINHEANELDFTLVYTFLEQESYSLKAGFTNYTWFFVDHFQWKHDTSQEVFFSADFNGIFLHPGITVFYDFGRGDGVYLQARLARRITISKNILINLSALLGYNGGQWLMATAETGFSDLTLGLSCAFRWKGFTVLPFLNYTRVLLEAIGKDDHFWFGLSLNFDLESR